MRCADGIGGFMEPLRSAIYTGGLWAQLLDNPSFEDNLWSAAAIVHMMQGRPELGQAARLGLPIPWESLYAQGARFEPRWGDAANSSRSLLIMRDCRVTRPACGRRSIRAVHRVLRTTPQHLAKPVSGGKPNRSSLRRHNRPDEVLAKAPIELTSGGWKRYEYALELAKGQLARREPADFAVTVSDEARVLIDQALLYPADHIDGLNPEAVAMTKALKLPCCGSAGTSPPATTGGMASAPWTSA